MKTPEEKAKELVARFNVWTSRNNSALHMEYDAKQCALICVDEKIESLLTYAGLLDIKKDVEELEEVKLEIEKL